MLESNTAAHIIEVQNQPLQKSAIFTYMNIISPETGTSYRTCYSASYEFGVLETCFIKL